jgi:uncharacterized membrane protein SirB2
MSLKAFHILFILVSILLALGFAVWELLGYLKSGDVLQLLAAIGSTAVSLSLVLYAIRFVKKLKNVKTG